MASGVYPHLAAKWCRFLDVPPDGAKVAAAIARRDASELEQTANAAGLPACMIREPAEWLAHPHGALLASQPVIGLQRIGDAPPRDFGPAPRPFAGIRVLSFTHAIAGPVVGRTLAEHGADVLCATRPNDYEHEFIYAEANLGSRSAYLDLANPAGQDRAAALLADVDIVVSNHCRPRRGTLPARAGPLRRFHPTGRRPHARPAGPVLHHRTRVASTASCPQRLKPSRMADLTLPGAKANVTTKVRPHDRGGLLPRSTPRPRRPCPIRLTCSPAVNSTIG